MNEKQRVKIIKRGTEAPKQEAENLPPSAPPNRQDAVTTVTEWVAEWRQKKEIQSTRAFHSLFRKAA
jgi:hypothetical protein